MSNRIVCPKCGCPVTAAELGGQCGPCLASALLLPPPAFDSVLDPREVHRRLGDYELLEEISRGGMGIVFRARQIGLGREVAVKLMRDGALARPEDVRRFQVEAAAVAKLKHPHIVAIHEVGEEHGQHYFAMDLIEGGNLADRTVDGPLPVREAAELMAKIADAVQHAHSEGVLHRDLKPSNVLVDAEGTPFVTDFGLAHALDTEGGLTLSGQILGTPGYMPPEQASGRGAVGPAADIYSLGALLFHLLTGRPPFVGASPVETLQHVREQEPISPMSLNPAVSSDLASVCLKCLGKQSNRRYAQARELVEDLHRFLRGEPTLARPLGQPERLLRWCQRKPALSAALAGAALIAVIGLTGVLTQWRRAREEALRARRSAYAADMNLISQALADNDIGQAIELLNRHRSPPGGEDLRGWEWRYAWQRTRSDEKASLGRHSDVVTSVVFTRDGGHMASGGHDGIVRVWETTAWKEVCRLTVPARVRTLAFSPDGKALAASSLDWKVTVWDWEREHRLAVFAVPAIGMGDGALAFTPDGKSLVTSDRGFLEVRNGADFQLTHRFQADRSSVTTVAFSPDGGTLASGGEENLVRFWDAESWELKAILPAPAHRAGIASLQYSPDGRLLLSSGFEPVVKLWSVDRLELLAAFHGNTNRAVHLAKFSGDGETIATVGADQKIVLWSTSARREVARLQGHEDSVSSMAFSPHGQALVSGGKDGWIKLWNTSTNPATNSFLSLEPGITRLGMSKDGGVVVAKYPTEIKIWSKDLGASLGRLPSERIASSSTAAGVIALGMTDGRVRILTLHPLREAAMLSGLHEKEVDGVALSPDGRLVASVDFAGQVQVRHWATRRQIAQWNVPSGFCSLAFAPDGQIIAIGSGDGFVRLGRVADAETLGILARYPNVVPGVTFTRAIRSMSFSPDGGTLAVAAGDSTTTLWDVTTRRLLATLRCGYSGVDFAAFSPDGFRLATCGGGVIKLWDLSTQREIFTLKDHPGSERIAFAPHGKTLISVGTDGIRYWSAPSFGEVQETEFKAHSASD